MSQLYHNSKISVITAQFSTNISLAEHLLSSKFEIFKEKKHSTLIVKFVITNYDEELFHENTGTYEYDFNNRFPA